MKCDICGEPATGAVRDVYRREGLSPYVTYTPHGDVHLYCDEHMRESHITDISTPLIDAMAAMQQLKGGGDP